MIPMKTIKILTFIVGIMLTIGCPSVPKTTWQITSQDKYVHTFSGINFPKQVGKFQRIAVKQYDKSGYDVSAGYNYGAVIAITVYVYPAPVEVSVLPIPKIEAGPDWLINSHFNRVKKEIEAAHPKTEIMVEGEAQIEQNGGAKSGKYVIFRYESNNLTAFSETYLFTHKKWFIKYRITYPEKYQQQCTPTIKQFMKLLTWPD